MARRQAATSGRRPRRQTSSQLPLNRTNTSSERRAEENTTKMSENAYMDDAEEANVGTSTTAMGTEIIVIDQDQDNANEGERIRSQRKPEKNTTPQKGLHKKKARFDLSSDSRSEEEIVFEDCLSTGSSKTSMDSPPTPQRIYNEDNDLLEEPQDKTADSEGEPPLNDNTTDRETTTMAETITRNSQTMQPTAHNILKSCRYTAQLLVPPHKEPVKKASETLQNVFCEIQKQAGKQVWLAAWQSTEDNLKCKYPNQHYIQ